jgi:hypothetical protein
MGAWQTIPQLTTDDGVTGNALKGDIDLVWEILSGISCVLNVK